MRKFLIKLVVFAALLFGIDRGMGVAMSYFSDHAIGGYVAHHNFINNEMVKDVLIFGSSRAVHHYDAKMIGDSLGWTCYNCGQDGSGIILNYGEWLMIKERCTPRLIIYDLQDTYDVYEDEPDTKFLGWLKPYYDRDGISEIFDDVAKTEKWKMMSMMYRNNSKALQIMSDYLHPMYEIDNYGFMPMDLQMDTMQVRKGAAAVKEMLPKIDGLKVMYLEKFIKSLNGTKLVISISPLWYGQDERRLKPVLEICKKYNIPFVDFSNDKKYVHNNEFFYNGTHLNTKGAEEFTRDFISVIRADYKN